MTAGDPPSRRARVHGSGGRLLYLHGLLGLAETARREAPSGFQVATYDQRGHGSGLATRDPAEYSIDHFVADAIAVLDELGWPTAALGGTSMGAAVALRLAFDYPHRVTGLLLVAPAYDDRPLDTIAFHDEIADDLDTLGSAGAAARRRVLMQARGFDREATAWLDSWSQHDPHALATASRAAARWTPFPDLKRLAALAIPIVVVGWPNDPLHPLALAKHIADLAHVPVLRIPGVSDVLARPEAISEVLTAATHDWH